MFFDDDLTLDCNTCVAANTTACSDCIVNHLLANDDGPIDLQPVPLSESSVAPERAVDRALEFFGRAGLIGDSPEFVTPDEFSDISAVPV